MPGSSCKARGTAEPASESINTPYIQSIAISAAKQVASLTEVQVAGLGALVGFLWDNSSGLDHTVSVQWGNAEVG